MSLDYIETFTGRSFRPLSPGDAPIVIEDIAHALSNQCRFSGHTRVHYSVAEHSVRVSKLLADWGAPKEEQLWGLLHDASEAYLVDIPAPLKSTPAFAAYCVAEAALQQAICLRFGLPVEQPKSVALADRVLLATEARDLMPFVPEHWEALRSFPTLQDPIEPWRPMAVKRSFLLMFEDLYL